MILNWSRVTGRRDGLNEAPPTRPVSATPAATTAVKLHITQTAQTRALTGGLCLPLLSPDACQTPTRFPRIASAPAPGSRPPPPAATRVGPPGPAARSPPRACRPQPPPAVALFPLPLRLLTLLTAPVPDSAAIAGSGRDAAVGSISQDDRPPSEANVMETGHELEMDVGVDDDDVNVAQDNTTTTTLPEPELEPEPPRLQKSPPTGL